MWRNPLFWVIEVRLCSKKSSPVNSQPSMYRCLQVVMKVLDAVVWLAEPSGENIEKAAYTFNVDLVVMWLRFGYDCL
jgi:hypothetical protein